MRRGGHTLEDLGETGDQTFAVRLVHAVLHGEIDCFWVWRRLAEGCGEESCALEIEDDVSAGVGLWENATGFGGGDFEVWDDGDGFDFGSPVEFAVVADSEGGLWRLETGVDAAGGGGEDF